MAQVTLHKIDKTYPGGVKALSGLSLEIADGELMVMVGPSGSGKTTTLRIVAGLERPSGGTISIGNRVVNDVPPRNRDVAMVFQNFALYPHKTVYENMAFGLKMRRVPRGEIQARIRQAAKTLKLEELLKRRPQALSGGQQQRVALGRAMVRKPSVFLFDEPLSNLDARLRGRMRVEINRLHRELDATMFYVTHDQAEAMTLGQRIVVVDRGEIQQVADPLSLYEQPANLFVAGFVGTPPMNFVQGCVRERDGRLVFTAESGFALPLPESRQAGPGRLGPGPVTLGIRPRQIECVQAEARPEDVPMAARVELVETLGAECLVHLDVSGETLVSHVASDRRFRRGDTLTASIRADKLHFFDPRTGKSVPRGDAGWDSPMNYCRILPLPGEQAGVKMDSK
jgi:multiple sugar transport system ATP-binding protein